jgi:hypothetical protein
MKEMKSDTSTWSIRPPKAMSHRGSDDDAVDARFDQG